VVISNISSDYQHVTDRSVSLRRIFLTQNQIVNNSIFSTVPHIVVGRYL